jgi:hypothetical protein
MPLYRGIVFVNCALGITSVAIQVKILVPWHDIISHQVDQLELQQKQLENRIVQLQSQLGTTTTTNQQQQLSNSNTSKKTGWFW